MRDPTQGQHPSSAGAQARLPSALLARPAAVLCEVGGRAAAAGLAGRGRAGRRFWREGFGVLPWAGRFRQGGTPVVNDCQAVPRLDLPGLAATEPRAHFRLPRPCCGLQVWLPGSGTLLQLYQAILASPSPATAQRRSAASPPQPAVGFAGGRAGAARRHRPPAEEEPGAALAALRHGVQAGHRAVRMLRCAAACRPQALRAGCSGSALWLIRAAFQRRLDPLGGPLSSLARVSSSSHRAARLPPHQQQVSEPCPRSSRLCRRPLGCCYGRPP